MVFERWQQLFGIVMILLYITFLSTCKSRGEDIYEKYCKKGHDGYFIFMNEVVGVQKRDFWENFRSMILDFHRKGKEKYIQASVDFWLEFSQDIFFETRHLRIQKEKREMDNIFKKYFPTSKYVIAPKPAVFVDINANSHNTQLIYYKFMNSPLPDDRAAIAKYPDLIAFKNNILGKAKSLQPLEEGLRTILNQVESIPRENDLNGLERYYKTHKNDQDNISRIVNTKFKYRLGEKVDDLWQKGLGGDANYSWNNFTGTVKKYKTYFGNTGYEDKIEFLVDYYTNRIKSNDNPGLITNAYRQVKNCSFPKETLHHMEQKWSVKSLQKLGASYEEYVNDFAKRTFSQAKDGSQKGKSEFDALIEVYELAVKDMPDFSLAPPWNGLFSQFKNYYYGSTNKKNLVNLIEYIYKEAAIAFGLSDLSVQKTLKSSTKTGVSNPEKTGEETSNPKNELIPFLEELWTYMQNTRNYKGSNIKLFQEILKYNRKSLNSFNKIQGLPLDFDFAMYNFVWICFYYKDGEIEKKQRAADILDFIKKKNKSTWKWLKEKYDKIF